MKTKTLTFLEQALLQSFADCETRLATLEEKMKITEAFLAPLPMQLDALSKKLSTSSMTTDAIQQLAEVRKNYERLSSQLTFLEKSLSD